MHIEHSQQVEFDLLGAILKEPSLFPIVSEKLDGNEFTHESTRQIFNNMQTLHNAGELIDSYSIFSVGKNGSKIDMSVLEDLDGPLAIPGRVADMVKQISKNNTKRGIQDNLKLISNTISANDLSETVSRLKAIATKAEESCSMPDVEQERSFSFVFLLKSHKIHHLLLQLH